jgi:hypothetical protein
MWDDTQEMVAFLDCLPLWKSLENILAFPLPEFRKSIGKRRNNMGNFQNKRNVELFVGCTVPEKRFLQRLVQHARSQSCQCKLQNAEILLKTYKYCPKCGKAFCFKDVTREGSYDHAKGKLGHFTVLIDHVKKCYLIGKKVSYDSSKTKMDTLTENMLQLLNNMLSDTEESLRNTLLDVALWDEGSYGIHVLEPNDYYSDSDEDDDSDNDYEEYMKYLDSLDQKVACMLDHM